MPVIVSVPEHNTEIEFPDGLSKEEMQSQIDKHFAPELPSHEEVPGQLPAGNIMGGVLSRPTPTGAAGGASRTPTQLGPAEPVSPLDQALPTPQQNVEGLAQSIDEQRAAQLEQFKNEGPAQLGVQPATIPTIGKEGTFVHGASEVAAAMGEWAFNNPEELLMSVWPPGQAALLVKYGPGMVHEFVNDVADAVYGDMGALGRASAMAALVGVPLGLKEMEAMRDKAAAKLEAERIKSAANAGAAQAASPLPQSEAAAAEQPKTTFTAPESGPAAPITEQPIVLANIDAPPAHDVPPNTAPDPAPPSTTTDIINKRTGAEEYGPSMGSANVDTLPEGNAADIYGISNRVRDVRASAGVGPENEPGLGISVPESIEAGQAALAKGADAEAIMTQFEATKRFSGADMGIVRAQGELLARRALEAAQEAGTDSDAYRDALDESFLWDERVKAMQTEWHKGGQAQQGETDIDTGSVSGLERAHMRTNQGEQFDAETRADAERQAAKVRRAQGASNDAKDALFRYIDRLDLTRARVRRLTDKIGAALDARADAARERMRGKLMSIDPSQLPDILDIVAANIFHMGMDLARVTEKTAYDLGEWIRPHMAELFDKAKERFNQVLQEHVTPIADEIERTSVRQLAESGRDIAASEEAAKTAAEKAVVEAATRVAKAETKSRVEAAKLAEEAATIKHNRDEAIAKAANKEAAERAAREAREKTKEHAERTRTSKAALDAEVEREKAALKAAEATRRAADIAASRSATTRRVQAAEANRAAAAERAKAELAAKKAAEKAVVHAASEVAKAERASRVARTEAETKAAAESLKATKAALKAAEKTKVEAAVRAAKAATEKRVADAGTRASAGERSNAARRALSTAARVVREAARRRAAEATRERVARADLPSYVLQKAKEYIDRGEHDFGSVVHKIAVDLGITGDDVRKAFNRDKKLKLLADDVWRKRQALRDMQASARNWLRAVSVPKWAQFAGAIPSTLFRAKVGLHGTVALGTHAPSVAFRPRFWKMYAQNFGKMYHMVGSKAYHAAQVDELLRRDNYPTAQQAGLQNNPTDFEDYTSPAMLKWVDKLYVKGMGDRGYTILKIMRQDMFDYWWDKLPRTTKSKEMAMAIADAVNHATGVTKTTVRGASTIAFAPRLFASRVAWMYVDPVKSMYPVLRQATGGKKMSPAEKWTAMNQFKEKVEVMATLLGLLAVNQGILSAVGSDQKINVNDPFSSDFLKFKAAGMDIAYGNGLISLARLPVRLYGLRSPKEGVRRHFTRPDQDTAHALFEYGRGQLSPFLGVATDFWLKSDYSGRPLPNAPTDKFGRVEVPKRLAAHGVVPYTWKEFVGQQVLPIPFEEAIREVGKDGFGMNAQQLRDLRRGLATVAVMGATGARVTEDVKTQR